MASTSKTSNASGYLKKIIGHPVGEFHTLNSSEKAVIGRYRPAQIYTDDLNVSRSHCILKHSENGWLIKDLKSLNGTYIDGKRLEPDIFYPLKDGAGIYLGPPGDATSAFVFLTKMPNEDSSEINMNNPSQRCVGGTTTLKILASNKRNKRPSDPDEPGTDGSVSPRKKATASSSSTAFSSHNQDFHPDVETNDNLSDCSISSQDSLRTRIKKISAKKNMSRNARNKDSQNAASSSASPQLRPSSNENFESKPSTSAIPAEKGTSKRKKVLKPSVSKKFPLLDTLFNESENSSPETIKGEDSQSLLNDSKVLIDCEPYPFSQPLEDITLTDQNQRKSKEIENKDSVEEQLQKAKLDVRKLQVDKLYLQRLVKDLRSEEKKVQTDLHKMLEDELMCNICTEVFMKAITLGCSHTFCEYCISEWKRKQKKCPICREKITSETKVLVLDSFVTKVFEQLDGETQNRRKELSATREKAKAALQKKTKRSRRGRNRRIQSESSDADEVRQIHGEPSNSIGLQIRFTRNSSPSIQVIQNDELAELSSDFSELSDIDSDQSVEGYGYFGGYGRCYTCGRRGHWANGCPYM